MLCSKCSVSVARLNSNLKINVKWELFYDPYRRYDQVFQTMPINKLAVCSQVKSIGTEHSGRQRVLVHHLQYAISSTVNVVG